jgi:HSP20 family molecular chaperone IbpA
MSAAYYIRDPMFLKFARMVSDMHNELNVILEDGVFHDLRRRRLGDTINDSTIDELTRLMEKPSMFVPALDLVEDSDGYTVAMDVPGMTSADLLVKIENGRDLIVEGRRRCMFGSDEDTDEDDDEDTDEDTNDETESDITLTPTPTTTTTTETTILIQSVTSSPESSTPTFTTYTTSSSSSPESSLSSMVSSSTEESTPVTTTTPSSSTDATTPSYTSATTDEYTTTTTETPPTTDDVIKSMIRERFVGSFQRSIKLPRDADVGNVDAVVQHGVLTITIGRKE